MSSARRVWMVVPGGIDDPGLPSGGNTYDRRVRRELASAGWSVLTRPVAGTWPWAGQAARRALATALGEPPDASVVLVDGLVASTAPEVLVPAARRLTVVVLLHMPVGAGDPSPAASLPERTVLAAAAAVVTSSGWSREWLLTAYGLDPARVHVAHPGVDPAAAAPGTPGGGNLLCVGAVTPGKGHDLLVAALATLTDRPWRCHCVGALTVAPAFVAELRRGVLAAGLAERLVLAGPLTGPALDTAYAEADLLVLASRGETFGMVLTEALARGLPVVATRIGGVPEAVGRTSDGRLPGLLLPAGDVGALADALRRWLGDPALRRRLRDAACERRTTLTGWSSTAQRVARVLTEVAA